MLWIQLFILIIVIWRDLYVIIWHVNIYINMIYVGVEQVIYLYEVWKRKERKKN